MNKRLKKGLIIMLIFSTFLMMGSVAFGIGDDVVKALQGGTEGIIGDGVMKTIFGLSSDVFNIVRYTVIAILIIKAFAIFSQFSSAGDNPQLKASLKARLLWTAGGLVLALNFWSLYNFIASTNLGL